MERYLLFFVCICLLLACRHTPSDQQVLLAKAEKTLNADPSNALHMLKQVHHYNEFAVQDKAQYGLLMSIALDKCDILTESDSLIRIAVDYFEKRDADKAGLAYFYLARCERNKGNMLGQTSALFKAKGIAEKSNDLHLQGMVNGEIARNYEEQQQYDSAAHYYRAAESKFHLSSDIRNSFVGIYRIAYIYYQKEEYDNSLRLLDKFEFSDAKILAKSILASVYRLKGMCYFYKKQYDKALVNLHKSLIVHDEFDYDKYLLLAYVFEQIDRPDSAEYYIALCHNFHKVTPDFFVIQQNLAYRKGHLKQVHCFSKQVIAAQDSLNRLSLKESFAGLEKKYKYEKLAFANQQLAIANDQKAKWLLVGVLIILLLIVAFLSYSLRNKKNELRQQLVIARQAEEKIRLQEERDRIKASLKLKIDNFKQAALLSFTPKVYGKSSPVKCSSKEIEEALLNIDAYNNQIIQRMKSHCPSLTNMEIRVALFALTGFTSTQIVELFSTSESAVNVHRSSFRKKIGIEGSIDWIEFFTQF